MKIAVIDGQGGGIGKALIEKMRAELPEDVYIVALGTNALATAAMMKSGASEGASGEAAVVYNAGKVDIICGTVAILAAHGMLGELTPAMAAAVAESPARKILVPLNKAGIDIVGVVNQPLPHFVNMAVEKTKSMLR